MFPDILINHNMSRQLKFYREWIAKPAGDWEDYLSMRMRAKALVTRCCLIINIYKFLKWTSQPV